MTLRVLLLVVLIAYCLKTSAEETDRMFVVFHHNSTRLQEAYKQPLKRSVFKYGKDTSKVFIVGYPRDACFNPYHFTWNQMQNVVKQVKNARGSMQDIVMRETRRYDTDTIEIICQQKGEWWYDLNKDMPPPPAELRK